MSMDGTTTVIEVAALAHSLGSAAWPRIVDVRRAEALEAAGRALPTARWRAHDQVEQWASELPPGEVVIVYCAHGHEIGQSVAAVLRWHGLAVRYLRGGYAAWVEAGLPTVDIAAARRHGQPGIWVTRERPKIDRIACPWLLRRFVDRDAVIHYVGAEETLAVALLLGGTAFDIAGAPLEHDGPLCTFDTMIRHFGIDDPTLAGVADIVRGADTHRFELAPQAAGLLAVSLGLSQLHGDDAAMLAAGLPIYDALYRWRRDAQGETHNWPSPASAAA
jgi:rhodanese-related sulfurtransferase